MRVETEAERALSAAEENTGDRRVHGPTRVRYGIIGRMPFRPPPGRAAPDPRLEPYRERAGALFREGEEVGVVYLRTGTFWWQTGGHLWWRSWSEPSEQVQGYIEIHGGFEDFVQDAHTMVNEIDDWQCGCFTYRGEVLQVHWLDHEKSRHVRVATFGLDENPDHDRPH